MFLRELVDVLRTHNLAGVLRLRLLRDSDRHRVEITEGLANVSFEVTDDFALADLTRYLQAAWMYRQSAPEGGGLKGAKPFVQRDCYDTCPSPSGRSHVDSRVSLPAHVLTWKPLVWLCRTCAGLHLNYLAKFLRAILPAISFD